MCKTDDSLAVMEESILIPEATAKGYAEATDGDSANLEQPNLKTRRGRVGKQMANTLTTSCNQGVVVSEPKAVSYTRDSKGKTQNKHLNEIVNTIHSSTGSGGNTDCFVAEPKVQQIGNIYPDKEGFKNRTAGRIFSADGLSPTLRTMSGGHQEPKIEFRYRIRKLTPRECFRLMDVDENVINTIQAAGISNSQQYKLAGNSIVVACLEKIFEQMFFPQYTNSRTLFG
jgi:DNA (cytosine-5)-methyltransferase 1